jgi:inhibitor of cysteine peptidase
MKELFIPLVVMVLLGVVPYDDYCKYSSVTGGTACIQNMSEQTNVTQGWAKFSSLEEMREYIKKNTPDGESGYQEGMMMEDRVMTKTLSANSASAPSAAQGTGTGSTSSPDYSKTNIQVAGVDEADIVKTDGEYIYVVARGNIFIVRSYPASEGKVVASINLKELNPQEIFVNGNRLVVFGSDSWEKGPEIMVGASGAPMRYDRYYYPSYISAAKVLVYDISDKANPAQVKELSVEGSYLDSRMIGDHVYFIVNQAFRYYNNNEDIVLPLVKEDGTEANITKYTDIHYFPGYPVRYYGYATLASLDLKDNKVEMKTVLSGSADTIYMSQDNLFITAQRYYFQRGGWALSLYPGSSEEKTVIHKIAVKDGSFEYVASGEVTGRILNQFSMDESKGFFRIATTTGNTWDATSKNHVFVLDKDMKESGKLMNLAPGEQIYSARFMGDRCYLVTFKKIDPLFVLDLSNPKSPKVLGKLKIPGYSDYLHPYDENHLIGIGKDALPSEVGDFAWYQGVKISLFDVSDVSKPREEANYQIGDRGTDSEALQDHKAFLFDKERNLLVLPIVLAEKDPRYKDDPQEYGDYTFQGAYVFSISPENGIKLRGRITHETKDEMKKMGYYYDSESKVRRSLYIGETLYTISGTKIKANDLASLKEQGAISLTESSDFCGRSTKANCDSDDDCAAGGCSGQVCMRVTEDISTTCEYRDCYNADKYGLSCMCRLGKCQWAE